LTISYTICKPGPNNWPRAKFEDANQLVNIYKQVVQTLDGTLNIAKGCKFILCKGSASVWVCNNVSLCYGDETRKEL
jgi:hypothetical protein